MTGSLVLNVEQVWREEREAAVIKVILWDIDGTLLNFEKAERYAIRKCFSLFGLGECTDEMLAGYSKINRKYWEKLERGELSKPEVLKGRFAEFFAAERPTFDKIEAFNEEYLQQLGEEVFFQDDGYELVKRLKAHVKQYAVTNGTYTAQKKKLEKSGLGALFDGVFISDKVGAEKPDIKFFDAVRAQIGHYETGEVMIVGDSLTSDMQGGNNAGILCCWYNPQGSRNEKGLRIDYEIADLRQVEEIVGKDTGVSNGASALS